MGFAESSNGDIRLLHMYGVERSGTVRAAQGAIPVNVYALTKSKCLPYKVSKTGVSHPPPKSASRDSTSSTLIPRLQSPESFTDAGDSSDVSRSQPTVESLAIAVSGRTYRRIRPQAAPSKERNIVRANSDQPNKPHSKPWGSRLSSNK
ncbi:hypothetical protein Landi51_00015 [Colletotrichum acutatum]